MYLQKGLLCLFVHLFNAISVESRTTYVGRYKVLKNGSKIKQCAAKVLSKDGSNALCVSKSPDVCEALVDPCEEEMLQLDNALFFKKQIYNPPFEVTEENEFDLKIPGNLSKWERIETSVYWQVGLWRVEVIFIGTTEDNERTSIAFSIFDNEKSIVPVEEYELHRKHYYDNDLPGKYTRISVVNDDDGYLKLLFDQEVAATMEPKRLPLDRIEQLQICLTFQPNESLKIHFVEFTDEI